jgi:hypothetical protein
MVEVEDQQPGPDTGAGPGDDCHAGIIPAGIGYALGQYSSRIRRQQESAGRQQNGCQRGPQGAPPQACEHARTGCGVLVMGIGCFDMGVHFGDSFDY